MHAGLLDMLHDAGHHDLLSVGNGIHVDFDGVLEIFVDEHRVLGRRVDGGGHVVHEAGLVVHDPHRASPQHVGRPDHDGIADRGGNADGLGGRSGGAAGRLPEVQFIQQLAEPFAVLRAVDGLRAGAEDCDAGPLQRDGELQGGLPAELHHDADRLLAVHDVADVFFRQRLEVEPVGRIVVGADGFRIAVDHDGFDAFLTKREGGMDAAVVELDPLPDAVRPAAQDDDFLPFRRTRLAGPLVGRIEIGRLGFEFGGAGVHALVGDAAGGAVRRAGNPLLSNGFGSLSGQLRDAAVGEAEPFGLPQ